MIKNKKYINLIDYLTKLDALAVAFSGGVDSTFLLVAAKEALGEKVIAVTINSPYIPDWEVEEAKELTTKYNIRHIILDLGIPEIIKNNPEDRCYLCKGIVFKEILAEAKKRGFKYLADGTNLDDMGDYRPGLKALDELNVLSPLLINKLTKQDIRDFSEYLGLPTWDKPAYACLLTRLPYNTRVNREDLMKIERSEKYLMDLGYREIRVRCHGDVARIEMPKNKIRELINEPDSNKIADRLKEFGFKYVTVDLQGYVMGSFNKEILKK